MGRPNKVKLNISDKATDNKTPSDQRREMSNGRAKQIEDLSGIGPKTALKLKELGYDFVGLATGRADIICQEMGQSVTYAKAVAWVKAAQESILAVMKPKTGKEVARERKLKRVFFKTGSSDFNALIGGGMATLRTTGLTGRYSTGKTQAIFDVIVDCIRDDNTKYCYCPMCNGRRGFLHDKPVETCNNCGREMFRKAAYVETEPDTFSAERLEQIAAARKVDIDLDNLWIFGCEDIPTAKAQYLQYKIIQKMFNGFTDDDGKRVEPQNIALVAVDSFTAKFKPGYGRSEMLPVRTREFTEHFLLIDYLASRYNVAWALSCQVIGGVRPDAVLVTRAKVGDKYYPVGGEYLLHSMNIWVNVQQIKGPKKRHKGCKKESSR